MLYNLSLLTILAALLLLAAMVGLLPRLNLTRGERFIAWAIVTLHLASMVYANVQVMSGALGGVDEDPIRFSIQVAMSLRIAQIVASTLMIYFNIRAYMDGNGGE